MNISDFYKEVGGSYEEVCGRLVLDSIIRKNLKKFPSDESFEKAKIALEKEDYEELFLAVHTLKGISGTLGLKALFEKASVLTEHLRNNHTQNVKELMSCVETEYKRTVELIAQIEDA